MPAGVRASAGARNGVHTVSGGRRRTQVLWRQLLRLQPASALTLQAQLRAELIAAIAGGSLPAQRPLPSSRALADQLGIARNTVVIVYQQLADDGYLIARRRQGYYPNPALLAQRPRAVAAPAAAVTDLDWSTRMKLRPSLQRNISKEPDWEQYEYPFIYGQLDRSLFPAAEWRASCQQVLSASDALDWVQDRFTRDDPSLIEQIRDKVLPLRGIWASAEEILVTIGAQHALYLLADLLVGCRRPRSGSRTRATRTPGISSHARTTRLRPLPLDEHGLRVGRDALGMPFHLRHPEPPVPDDRDDAGGPARGTSAPGRADDFLIIEDDYETEVSFSGPAQPGAQEPRPQQSRHLRRQPLQVAGPGTAPGLHRRTRGSDRRASGLATADDPPSERFHRTQLRAVPGARLLRRLQPASGGGLSRAGDGARRGSRPRHSERAPSAA